MGDTPNCVDDPGFRHGVVEQFLLTILGVHVVVAASEQRPLHVGDSVSEQPVLVGVGVSEHQAELVEPCWCHRVNGRFNKPTFGSAERKKNIPNVIPFRGLGQEK